jgi:carboxypeptidase C (cathepsin A)
MIEVWKDTFNQELKAIRSSKYFNLLVDTNKHNFESIQCLKNLREYLTKNPALKSNCKKAAFVSPAKYMTPKIESETVAYFDNLEQAYIWLKE